MSTALGERDYRMGALERLREAWILLQSSKFGGSVYLAGRAVEGMLRALIWKHDVDVRTGRKSVGISHDLREILIIVRALGVLPPHDDGDKLVEDIQYVARLWLNSMRYFPTRKVETYWWKLGEIRKRRTLKQAATEYFDACSSIVKKCEALCEG